MILERNAAIIQGYRELIAQYDGLFVTLTYQHDVSVESAKRHLKHYTRRLNRLMFNRSAHELEFVAIIELKGGRAHVHCVFKALQHHNGRTKAQQLRKLQAKAIDAWLKMSGTTELQKGLDARLVTERVGLAEYLTKQLSVGGDWQAPDTVDA